MKLFGRRDQPAAADDRSKLIKNVRFHGIHPPECKKKLAPSVNEVQPIRDELWKDVGIHHDDDADDGCERHGVPENKAEDGAFVADLVGGRGSDADGLRVNHLAHHAAGAVGCTHENWAEVELLGSDFLQAAEENVGRRVAAREGYSEPTDESAKERKEPARTRECETQNGVHARVAG